MPGDQADVEQRIKDAAGAPRPHVSLPSTSRPVRHLPSRHRADRSNPAIRLTALPRAFQICITLLIQAEAMIAGNAQMWVSERG
jgi:hypothetical protein